MKKNNNQILITVVSFFFVSLFLLFNYFNFYIYKKSAELKNKQIFNLIMKYNPDLINKKESPQKRILPIELLKNKNIKSYELFEPFLKKIKNKSDIYYIYQYLIILREFKKARKIKEEFKFDTDAEKEINRYMNKNFTKVYSDYLKSVSG